MSKTPVCERCETPLVRCNQYGRPAEDGTWLVCPAAIAEFPRDSQGFYYKRPGKTVHSELKVSRPPGFLSARRKAANEAQAALFDEEVMRKRTLRKSPSQRELSRGLE